MCCIWISKIFICSIHIYSYSHIIYVWIYIFSVTSQAPTNAPTNPLPTTSPTTKSPTEPVTCLCCLNSPGFGDYFKLEQGGFLLSQGTYGDGLTKCTSSFLTEGTNTLNLPKSICNVEMLLIGGGGGGGGSFNGELLKSSTYIYISIMIFILVYFWDIFIY